MLFPNACVWHFLISDHIHPKGIVNYLAETRSYNFVSVKSLGFKLYLIVVNLSLQYVHFLQRKYSLSSFNLLGHTAPAQAASLLLVGPFLDYRLTSKRIDAYQFSAPSLVSASASYWLFTKIPLMQPLQIECTCWNDPSGCQMFPLMH